MNQFLSALLATLLTSVAFADTVHMPPVTQATCPVPLQMSPVPPGGTTGVLACVAQVTTPVITPEVAALLQSSTYKLLYSQVAAREAAQGVSIKVYDYQIFWDGVGQGVSVEISGSSQTGPPRLLGVIGGQVWLDESNTIVIEGISTTIGEIIPGGATVGNQ